MLAAVLSLWLDVGSPVSPDLALELKARERIRAGEDPLLELALVNRCASRCRRVVKPNDGSEVGWREPYVFWSAEVRGEDGAWRRLEPQGYGRCGLYAFDWEKDVVDLGPGERIVLRDWLRPARDVFRFRAGMRVRLTAHYRYRALRADRGARDNPGTGPLENGPMKGIKPFELRSRPVEFLVEE